MENIEETIYGFFESIIATSDLIRYDPHQDESNIDYINGNYYTATIVLNSIKSTDLMNGKSTKNLDNTCSREKMLNNVFWIQFDFYGSNAYQNAITSQIKIESYFFSHPNTWLGLKEKENIIDLSSETKDKKIIKRYSFRSSFWALLKIKENTSYPFGLLKINDGLVV